jgi:hypothetical protein
MRRHRRCDCRSQSEEQRRRRSDPDHRERQRGHPSTEASLRQRRQAETERGQRHAGGEVPAALTVLERIQVEDDVTARKDRVP